MRTDEAMACYVNGGVFSRAVELARQHFPAQVVQLEEKWGNHLVQNKELESVVNHFIEAG